MDTSANTETVRLLTTAGDGTFFESNYVLPEVGDTDILVKSVMTGVCRSDIDMMQGNFQLLPEHMHGHEGLGIVEQIGESVTNVAIGDFVATRGEPAYADKYVARQDTYVKVPELDPKYIIEPVACGVNVIMDSFEEIRDRVGGKVCIIGSGFLARVAFSVLNYFPELQFEKIDVVGRSNQGYWGKLLAMPEQHDYDIVIDLSDKSTLMHVNVAPNGLIIMAAEKEEPVVTNFNSWLWNNVTMKFPSPRSNMFSGSMKFAVKLIKENFLDIDNVWTKGYNRDNEWKQAFADAANRPEGYNRGYIEWN
jgi:hypothetical protein